MIPKQFPWLPVFFVKEAIELWKAGKREEEILDALKKLKGKTQIAFFVGDVSILMRIRPIEGIKKFFTGRVELKTALSFLFNKKDNAVLYVKGGLIRVFRRVKTYEEAKSALKEFLLKFKGKREVEIVIGHTGLIEEAKELKEELREFSKGEIPIIFMSPIVLAGAGPYIFGYGIRVF